MKDINQSRVLNVSIFFFVFSLLFLLMSGRRLSVQFPFVLIVAKWTSKANQHHRGILFPSRFFLVESSSRLSLCSRPLGFPRLIRSKVLLFSRWSLYDDDDDEAPFVWLYRIIIFLLLICVARWVFNEQIALLIVTIIIEVSDL